MAGGGIKINNTKIIGGADGATFIPIVDEEGNLSWSNNKGYSNPPTVNIKGRDGANGKDGKNGATGAIITDQRRIAVDEDGWIYRQTFDTGFTTTFTAPKGDDGKDGTGFAFSSQDLTQTIGGVSYINSSNIEGDLYGSPLFIVDNNGYLGKITNKTENVYTVTTLLSLKGKDGINGINGRNGINGINGKGIFYLNSNISEVIGGSVEFVTESKISDNSSVGNLIISLNGYLGEITSFETTFYEIALGITRAEYHYVIKTIMKIKGTDGRDGVDGVDGKDGNNLRCYPNELNYIIDYRLITPPAVVGDVVIGADGRFGVIESINNAYEASVDIISSLKGEDGEDGKSIIFFYSRLTELTTSENDYTVITFSDGDYRNPHYAKVGDFAIGTNGYIGIIEEIDTTTNEGWFQYTVKTLQRIPLNIDNIGNPYEEILFLNKEDTEWVYDEEIYPYKYKTTKNLSNTAKYDYFYKHSGYDYNLILELINDNPILFAKYGFAIGSVTTKENNDIDVTIYCSELIEEDSITLRFSVQKLNDGTTL